MSYWDSGAQMFPTKWLADSVEKIAEKLFQETRLRRERADKRAGERTFPFWRRTFRYHAEREATGNVLCVREGKPTEIRSRLQRRRMNLRRRDAALKPRDPHRATPIDQCRWCCESSGRVR